MLVINPPWNGSLEAETANLIYIRRHMLLQRRAAQRACAAVVIGASEWPLDPPRGRSGCSWDVAVHGRRSSPNRFVAAIVVSICPSEFHGAAVHLGSRTCVASGGCLGPTMLPGNGVAGSRWPPFRAVHAARVKSDVSSPRVVFSDCLSVRRAALGGSDAGA